jgi:peptidoglycan hydrolase-like protein with peptidoglycan-binding domain
MDLRDVQSRLVAAHLYDGKVDGDLGPQTRAAISAFLAQQGVKNFDAWPSARRQLAAQQLVCKLAGINAGAVDGLLGTQTRYAFGVFDLRKAAGGPVPVIENWRHDETAPQAVATRPLPAPITSSQVNAPATKPAWPKQSAMDSFYGAKGINQVSLVLPFAMRIAWDTGSKVTKFSCHKKVRESLERIFARQLDHYGLAEIQRLGLDLYGGCLNVRLMRGSTSSWSIHSWGCAVDIDPEHNQLNFHRAQATLDNPPFDPFWRFVYDEGAIGLGRERDYDWMHFQFARL